VICVGRLHTKTITIRLWFVKRDETQSPRDPARYQLLRLRTRRDTRDRFVTSFA
jgi:hypothetical protein